MSLRLKAKLLIRMVMGIASEKEKQNIYNSHESISMLEQVWNNNNSEISQSSFDKQKLFQKISSQIDNNNLLLTIRWYQKPTYRVAASIAALVAISLSLIYIVWDNGKFTEKQVVTVFSGSNSMRQIDLPDGSKVFLNKQTTIKYPKVFNDKVRRVELSGEAIFEVSQKPKQPFIVSAHHVEVEVLGTVFNVMAYPTDGMVTATLISGKVKFKHIDPKTSKEQSVILSPNHSATYYFNQNRFEVSMVDVSKVTAWEQGKLIISDEPIERVVSKLNRWYGIEITLSNDLKGKYRLTMTIDNETIDEALLIISKTIPIGYTKSDKQVSIYLKQ